MNTELSIYCMFLYQYMNRDIFSMPSSIEVNSHLILNLFTSITKSPKERVYKFDYEFISNVAFV